MLWTVLGVERHCPCMETTRVAFGLIYPTCRVDVVPSKYDSIFSPFPRDRCQLAFGRIIVVWFFFGIDVFPSKWYSHRSAMPTVSSPRERWVSRADHWMWRACRNQRRVTVSVFPRSF